MNFLLKITKFKLSTLIEEITYLFKPIFAQKNISFEVIENTDELEFKTDF